MIGRLERAATATVNALRVLPAAGEPGYPSPGEIAAGPRLERLIERAHSLGPRPLAEMLAEIAAATGRPDLIADRVEAYSKLDPEIVRAVGGDRFAPMSLQVVR